MPLRVINNCKQNAKHDGTILKSHKIFTDTQVKMACSWVAELEHFEHIETYVFRILCASWRNADIYLRPVTWLEMTRSAQLAIESFVIIIITRMIERNVPLNFLRWILRYFDELRFLRISDVKLHPKLRGETACFINPQWSCSDILCKVGNIVGVLLWRHGIF